MIEIRDVKKNFGNLSVLGGISLNIQKGDVVALLGSSGSGKTTLLRIMNFLETADSGTMIFGEERLDLSAVTKKQAAMIRGNTSFVFQNYNLWANNTALQNVMLALTVARKVPAEKARTLAMAALEKVNMSRFAAYYPHQLSGGQQQRVAIARAIVTEPEIIYFDEPTSALDPELTGEVLDVIRKLAADGMTMLIVTHEMSFARSVSTKTVILDKGQIVEQGDTEEVFENPKNERTKLFVSGRSE